MSDIGSDSDAAEEMMYAAQSRLAKKLLSEGRVPGEHRLLAPLFMEDSVKADSAWSDLLKEYSRNPLQSGKLRGAMEVTYAVCNYLIALEIALGERKSQTVVAIKRGISKLPPPGTCEGDEDFPF